MWHALMSSQRPGSLSLPYGFGFTTQILFQLSLTALINLVFSSRHLFEGHNPDKDSARWQQLWLIKTVKHLQGCRLAHINTLEDFPWKEAFFWVKAGLS